MNYNGLTISNKNFIKRFSHSQRYLYAVEFSQAEFKEYHKINPQKPTLKALYRLIIEMHKR